MHRVLWIFQAILAVKLLSVSFTHAFRQDLTTMQEAIGNLGSASQSLLYASACLTFLGALGLILPGLLPLQSKLIPLTAGILALGLLGSIPLHVMGREQPKIFVSLILFLMTVFVAYGRWYLAPIS